MTLNVTLLPPSEICICITTIIGNFGLFNQWVCIFLRLMNTQLGGILWICAKLAAFVHQENCISHRQGRDCFCIPSIQVNFALSLHHNQPSCIFTQIGEYLVLWCNFRFIHQEIAGFIKSESIIIMQERPR